MGQFMTKAERRRKSEAGYSLIEMVVVVGIMSVLGGMAVFQMTSTRSAMKGDAAMRVVLSQLNYARENAITQRRNMKMVFDLGNRVQVLREETDGTTTVLTTMLFESGSTFGQLVSGDTPDTFGNSSTDGITFTGATGTPLQIRFTPDGKFVNQDGATQNGTVLVGNPGDVLTARAVTVMGSTGRIRGYRWDGRNWQLV
jgi:prepilin-type N-terminal cleavage/methylation domain-containing protein